LATLEGSRRWAVTRRRVLALSAVRNLVHRLAIE